MTHGMLEEEAPAFEMAAMPTETTQAVVKVKVAEGMSAIEIEAPESIATHLLNQFYLRQDRQQARNVEQTERILRARGIENHQQTEEEGLTRM